MKFLSKRRTRIALAALLFGAASLAACGGESVPSSGPGTSAAEAALAEAALRKLEDARILPAEKRLAFVSGHVTAGLALYRAGVPGEAAAHLLHAVSETYATERAGFEALGFNPEIFAQLTAALEAGTPAADIEPVLAEAEANLLAMRTAAGGEPKVLIEYLMKSTAESYEAGVEDGEIASAEGYQAAYGFAVVARDIAGTQDPALYGDLKLELDLLVLMWPGKGPLAASTPAPEMEMGLQLARVKSALSSLP